MLECGNSGTTMRLLCGVVATIDGTHHLDGDASLRRRPMDRVARPLGQMGAAVRGVGSASARPSRSTAARCAPSATSCRSRAPR